MKCQFNFFGEILPVRFFVVCVVVSVLCDMVVGMCSESD